MLLLRWAGKSLVWPVHGSNAVCACCHRNPDPYVIYCVDETYYHYIPPGNYCVTCLIRRDDDYARSMRDDELPLWLSHLWLSTEAENIYKTRLKKYLGA